MPEKIEAIMKKIHILFAKSEEYNGSADKVIISKKEMFDILEELNVALYQVLDQYEATSRSKEKARLEMERMANDIISDAKKSAEDVNAASLMYTDTMLDELRAIVDNTARNVSDELRDLRMVLDERMAIIGTNRDEVRKKLQELHDSEFYVEALDKKRRDEEAVRIKKENGEIQEEDEVQEETEEEIVKKKASYTIKINEAYMNKTAGVPNTAAIVNAESTNLDAEYFQWQDENNADADVEKTEKKQKKKLFKFGK